MADKATVFERMVRILDELPAIGKNQKNAQQGFNFRGHDDVLNALNPLLAKHGVFIIPDVLERIPAERQTKSGSTMYEVNLHVRFFFYGEDGDSFTASTWGEGTDSGDKATNKAMTMAFKNILIQAFAINTSDNVDADHETPAETTRSFQSRGADVRDPRNAPEPTLAPDARNVPFVPLPSGDDPGSTPIGFGKHTGQTLASLYRSDDDGASYVQWVAFKMEPKGQSGADLQEAAKVFLQGVYNKLDANATGDRGPAEPWGGNVAEDDSIPFDRTAGGDR